MKILLVINVVSLGKKKKNKTKGRFSLMEFSVLSDKILGGDGEFFCVIILLHF